MIKKTFNNFKKQPDVWFFYGFLITFPLSIRKVLFFYPIGGQFNEYSGIYLYLSDIFLILALLSYFFILYNDNRILSIIKSIQTKSSKMFHPRRNVPRGTLYGASVEHFILMLVILAFFSLFWASNKNVAVFGSLKLLEFLLLVLYASRRIVPRGTFLRNSFGLIIISGLIQSIIGIWQFIIQHSIGLFWLKESLISPNISGVAKLVFGGSKMIRAYGLFPHPNILGGFLLLSITLTLSSQKMFFAHPEEKKCSTPAPYNVPRGTFILGLNIFSSAKMNQYVLWIIIAVQIVALLLTFSKSAMMGLIVSLTYIFVPRGTNWQNLFRMAKNVPRGTQKKLFLAGLIILVLAYLFHPSTNSFITKSIQDRLFLTNVSRGTILSNPIFGLGIGQFVLNMQHYANQTLLDWQYQPVHNVFMLIWTELGLIGLLIFIILLWKMFHVEHKLETDTKCSTWNISSKAEQLSIPNNKTNVPRGTILNSQDIRVVLRGILLGFIFIMLFDHYFWDIQQGEILFWLVIGIIVGIGQKSAIDK